MTEPRLSGELPSEYRARIEAAQGEADAFYSQHDVAALDARVTTLAAQLAEAQRERDEARWASRLLVDAWDRDSRPLERACEVARAFALDGSKEGT